MIKSFSVKNYRGFKDEITMDFVAKSYEYNESIIKNNLVNKAIIYGKNGIGKSNLGYAIFDIITHISDNFIGRLKDIEPYINLDSDSKIAEFKYIFLFDNDEVKYEYGKYSIYNLAYEKLFFNGKLVLNMDFSNLASMYYDKEYTKDIDMSQIVDNSISVIKFISGRIQAKEIKLLKKMVNFVNNMLWYRSLSRGNEFFGFKKNPDILIDILKENNKLDDFILFLKRNSIDLNLSIEELQVDDKLKNTLIAKYEKGDIIFKKVASTGTMALLLFYTWKIQALDNVSLLFIDEFDAFLHYESAVEIIKELNKINSLQVIITSHNTYLMKNEFTRPDCCYIMTQNKISKICDCTFKDLREGHNLGKMYRAGKFDE